VPAQQRLDPHDAPRRHVELRLVDEVEFAALASLGQVALEPPPCFDRVVQARLVETEPAAALLLRLVERQVRPPQ
jgi:hypothetical protein